ncbi:MAG: trigger factor [Pseudomonadota bacterium]
MKISIETTSNLERRLTIVVPSEQFENEITARLDKARQQVRLPGFRPGKVPMREVRRRFGTSVRAEVAGETMQNSFVEAVQQEQLNPAGNPNLEVIKMDPGIDFEFTATFEVFPAVELRPLDSLSVVRPVAEVADSDIDATIERLREQRKTYVVAERPAQDGDKVTIDFVGRLDGEVFEGGSGEDTEVVVGAGQMIADFDAALPGVSAGEEKTFEAAFPEDYQAENLAGQTAEFTITVKEVAEPQLPEVGPELFAEFGVESDDETEFRGEVRNNMQRELDNAIGNQVKQQLLDQLVELHEVPLPEAMVQRELGVLKQQMLQQFQLPPGSDAPDLPDELFRDQAERRVTLGLIMNEIVTRQSIEADADLVRARIETLASAYAEPEQVINYYYSNTEQLNAVESSVVEEQVVDWLLEQGTVDDKAAAFEEVMADTVVPKKEPPAPAGDEAAAAADETTDA